MHTPGAVCARALVVHPSASSLRPGIILTYQRGSRGSRGSRAAHSLMQALPLRTPRMTYTRGTPAYNSQLARLLRRLGDTSDVRSGLFFNIASLEAETNEDMAVLYSVIVDLTRTKMNNAARIRALEPIDSRESRWRSIARLRVALGISANEAAAQACPHASRSRMRVCPVPRLQCKSVQRSWSTHRLVLVSYEPGEACVVCGKQHSPQVYSKHPPFLACLRVDVSLSRPVCHIGLSAPLWFTGLHCHFACRQAALRPSPTPNLDPTPVPNRYTSKRGPVTNASEL